MPALPPPVPFCKVAVYGNVQGSPTVNVFHYVPASGSAEITEGDAELMADYFQSEVAPVWVDAIAETARIGSAYVEVVTAETVFASSAVIALDGTVAGDSLPAQDQVVIRWAIPLGVRTKKVPGRTNIAGIPESATVVSQITTAEQGKINALAEILNGPIVIGPNTWNFVIYSPTTGNMLETLTYYVNPQIKVLRRRRPIS